MKYLLLIPVLFFAACRGEVKKHDYTRIIFANTDTVLIDGRQYSIDVSGVHSGSHGHYDTLTDITTIYLSEEKRHDTLFLDSVQVFVNDSNDIIYLSDSTIHLHTK